MVITNLFSIFDPSTSINISINWLSITIWIRLIISSIYLIPGRRENLIKKCIKIIYQDIIKQIKKNPSLLIFPLTLILFIIINNLLALIPFVFPSTSHIVFTFSLSLICWLSTTIFIWLHNLNKTLSHLIPIGTPILLIPFIVLIETIRITIRPITLAVRLAANIIAGHLLITLLISTPLITSFIFSPFLIITQTTLTLLEIAVAIIQAYVFRILVSIYISERI